MASINTDAGGLLELDILFGTAPKMTTFTLQLLSVMTTPSDQDTNATHIVTAGGGYADKTLSNNATIAVVNNIPTATWALQEWTFTGPLTTNLDIVGYRILNGTTVLAEETFAAVITPLINGDKVRLIPRYLAGNGTPT